MKKPAPFGGYRLLLVALLVWAFVYLLALSFYFRSLLLPFLTIFILYFIILFYYNIVK